jgi:hypothetical protein
MDPSLSEMMGQAKELMAIMPSICASDPDMGGRLDGLFKFVTQARAKGSDGMVAWLRFHILFQTLRSVISR